MTIEVMGTRIGELRLDDFALSARAQLEAEDEVVATVLAPTGAVVRVRLGFALKPAGYAAHIELGCQGCGRPARVLRLGSDGGLTCHRCCPHRTARQLQRTTRWWRQLDGAKTDMLVRLALRPGQARLEEMTQLARGLARADRARLLALRPKIEAALAAELELPCRANPNHEAAAAGDA
jgi:hypothetical protein